jgi:hypothetical protein
VTDMAEAVREGSSLEIAPAEINPENAQRAKSLALPSPTALAPVAERVRSAAAVAASIGAKAAELADRPGSLVHAQPPTFVQARVRHHAAARQHGAPLLRALRLTYGYLHMVLVKSVLNAIEWVTETPLRVLVTAVLVLIIWLWS